MKEFQNKLETLSKEDINKLQNNETITISLSEKEIEVTSDMVEIRIDSKEGYNVGMENNNFIILDTTLTNDLILEGIARETVSKIQQMRKNMEFDIVDRIEVYYSSNDEYSNAIKANLEFIMNETLAVKFERVDEAIETVDINGYSVGIKLKKA